MDYIYKSKYVHYVKEGSGLPVILLHGWGTSSQTFVDTINLLKKKYTVYAIDLPGFGKSIEPDDGYTLDNYVELLELFIKDKNIYKPTIIGHSFGGRISIKYASTNTNIDKLVLIDSAGLKPKDIVIIKYKIVKYKIKKKWYRLKKDVTKYNELITHSGSTDYQNASPVMKKTLSNVTKEYLDKYLKKINVETLIIWGTKDNVTPYKDALKLKKKIKKSGLVPLEGVGHFSYLEARRTYLKIIATYFGVDI